MQISKEAKEIVLKCVKLVAEEECYGGSDLVDFERITEKALDMAMKATMAWKMTLQRGEFTERGLELFFNDSNDLVMRILPKNKDQWEYCAFTKDEAMEFVERFNDMIPCFEASK